MEKDLKAKTFCKWEKGTIKKNRTVLYDLTAAPNYFCGKCARVAKQKHNVCKPFRFDSGK